MTVGMGETVEVLVGTSKLEVLKAQTGSTMLAIFPIDDFCMCMVSVFSNMKSLELLCYERR